jgi:hypothetical protein
VVRKAEILLEKICGPVVSGNCRIITPFVHGIERGGGWAIERQGMFLIAAVSVALLGVGGLSVGGLSVGGLSVGGRYGRRN